MKKYKASEFPNMVCYKQHEVESLSALTDAQAGLAFKVLGAEAYNLPKPEVKDPIVLAFLPLLREGVIGRLNYSREQSKKGKSGGKKSAANRKNQAGGQAGGQAINIRLYDDEESSSSSPKPPLPHNRIPTKEEVEEEAAKNGIDKKWAEGWYIFAGQSTPPWTDKGKPIRNWKLKLLRVWEAEKKYNRQKD